MRLTKNEGMGEGHAQTTERLEKMIHEIGVARFAGRLQSGVLPKEVGYEVLYSFVSKEKERPLLSRIAHIVLQKKDRLDGGL